jgi:endonuclease/exonuclease/phosphatase family metal-dependent hydrolase
MLRVMSYNVRYFGHQNPVKGARSTRRGLAGIAEALAVLPELPHVIGLQEVEARSMRSGRSHTPGEREETQLGSLTRLLNHRLEQRRRAHRYAALYFPAHAYGFGKLAVYTTGLAVLVRDDVGFESSGPVRDVTFRRNHPLARFKQSRICAHLRVRAPDLSTIDVFNTHLSLPQFFSARMLNGRGRGRMGWGQNQLAEVRALADFVHESKSSERFVVFGDFNAQPGSPAYAEVVERLVVRDAVSELTGVREEELKRQWPSAGFLNLRMRLDHLFLGAGLTPVDIEDTEPFGQPGRWHGLSDHVPQIGRIAAVG